MAKIRKPPSFKLVDVTRDHEIKKIRYRARRNLRSHTTAAVYALTALFLFPGITAFATRGADLSTQKLPAWIAVIFVVLLMLSADVLATISLFSRKEERYRNRVCALAFGLIVISYALIAILASIVS